MSVLSISTSSDEEILFNAGEDPVICWTSSKLNKRNRVEIRKRDYLRLEEWGILNLKQLTVSGIFGIGFYFHSTKQT